MELDIKDKVHQASKSRQDHITSHCFLRPTFITEMMYKEIIKQSIKDVKRK